MHNKHLRRISTIKAENLEVIAHKKYGNRKSKTADIQALNTRIYYDIIRQDRTPAPIIFVDLVSNYDLLVHIIASLYLQRVNAPKETILCNFTNLQKMTHLVRTSFGESLLTYGGDT